MVAKIVAAIAIVFAGAIAPVKADPWHGYRGRGRRWQRNYRHWDRRDYNPLPGFLGGVFGGWLGSQINKDRDDDRDERDYRDDRPRD